VVDNERLVRLLDGVRRDVRVLRDLSASGEELPSDEVRLSAVKYRFITAIEGCAKVAHHVVAAEGWAAPETNAGAVRELAEHGVTAQPVSEAIARAVGFRNLLVHRYADIDDNRVVDQLNDLDDLDAFVAQVGAWLLTASA
jgi:uncharacterized protein YutE (UPF0331/DUF86 family)